MKPRILLSVMVASAGIILPLPLVAARQILHGQVPEAVARMHLQSVGRLAGTNRLALAIGLPLRNQEALTNLLHQLYDPASPNYHRYLTPEEFTKRFGPTEQDYQAVIAFAKAHGLRVTATHPNRVLVDVNGSVADIEKALHVTLRNYQHPTEKRRFHAPDTEPSLDLAIPILSISGLDDYSLPRPRLRAEQLANLHNASANTGSGPGGGYMGTDFRAAYVPDTSLDGSGQVVGLLQFEGYSPGDIAYYENLADLPNVPLQNVLVDGATGNPSGSGNEVEVCLDIEMAISMATNLSEVVVYMAPNPSPFEDILNRMVNDNVARQLSCSWYQPGGTSNVVTDQIFQQMAAQGQSFFNASGDYDAYTGLIDFPGDTSYITQVGGTTLTTAGPGGSWVSETVWNWGNGIGSGGGISTQYPIPSWQMNINMTVNQGSTLMRNTPDVALTADNVYVRAMGVDRNVGGTSAAAPLWAGFAALVNQQAAMSGKPSVGFINPAVDAIGTGTNYSAAFHDITTGDNTSSSSPAKFYAVSGYDLCTGWGTPAGQPLINALASPKPLVIAPPTGFTSIGGFGGPFTVMSQTFTLTNTGTDTLAWTLSNTSAWLNVSSGGGTLTPGGPAAALIVSLNSVASNLAVGTYTATIFFTNLNENFGQSRQIILSVITPPVITQQPLNQSVLEGDPASFNVISAGGLPQTYQWQFNGTNLADGGNISGSATTNLVINPVTANNAGVYTVVVANPAGSVTSSNAQLALIPSPPLILTQPGDQAVIVGNTASFSVVATRSTPLYYQWMKNGTNLPGATGTNLIIANVQTNDTGIYAVGVTNAYGGVVSSNALLTVIDPSVLDSFYPVMSANGYVYSTAVQADGKILISGGFYTLNGYSRPYFGRLNADGTTDASFDPKANGWINALAVQPDGKILVGGYFTMLGGQNRTNIGRLNANGTIDMSFNPGTDDGIYSLVMQADGKILVGGWFSTLVGQGRLCIGRLNADGTLDTSFNPGAPGAVISMAVQADGRIVVVGGFNTLGGHSCQNIGRLNADGTFDVTFNPRADDIVRALAIQADGKILVGGSFITLGGQSRSHIGRLNPDGTVDATFNPRVDNYPYPDVVSLALQADGKILVGGLFLTMAGQSRGCMGRLNADGTLDTSFILGADMEVLSMALQADGKILVGGAFTTLGGQSRPYMARLHPTVPTTQSLTFNGSTITWLRGGSSPEVWRATFDGSINGTTWVTLGAGTRVAGGWQLGGLAWPTNANLRARGFVAGGGYGDSGWFVETVVAPPIITNQPSSLTIPVGGTAAFTVGAGSFAPPLSYQWRFNGSNIPGATNVTLVLTNVPVSQAGNYSVLVTNLFGSTLSSYATLTVYLRPLLGAIWSGDALLIFWPVDVSGFVLEASPSLFPANWVPVTNPPAQVGDQYQESIQPTNSSCFYRLRFPGP